MVRKCLCTRVAMGTRMCTYTISSICVCSPSVPCNERDPPQRSCDDGQCIGGEQFCDFTTDCDDGSDENVLQCSE